MKPQPIFPGTLQLADLPELHRLVHHIQHTAINSEKTPIKPQEVAAVSDRVIHTLVWQYPHLDQVIQESLDDLRFKEA